MELIDTHCHLYLDEFATDRKEMIRRAKEAGVSRFYLPAISSAETDHMLAMEQAFPGVCIPMMGLHPCYVKDDYRQELDLVAGWLEKRSFTAIGEIGLDYYWDTTYAKEQWEAFTLQMQWALDKGLPIVIHTRNAMADTLTAVRPFAEKGLRGIFHCFSGNAAEAAQIVSMGFYLGIGGVITYKNAGLAEALENISIDKLVLETDAPYLTPVPFRGKRNESGYLTYIVAKLAVVKNLPETEVARITTQNAQKIFGY